MSLPDRIARLNADGSTDTSFNPVTGLSAEGHCVAVMNDGKIVAGGAFTTPRNRLAVFNANGSLNAANVPANWDVYGLTKQTDGKLIVVGRFTTLGGAAFDRIGRLNSALALEPAFSPGANGTVRVATVKPDGKIMVAGAFTGMGDRARDRIARLHNDAADSVLTVVGASLVQWLRGGAGQETVRVTFELDTGGGYAAIPGTIARISGGWTLVPTTPLSGDGTVRARAFPEDSHSGGIHEALRVFNFVPEISVDLDGADIATGGTLDFGTLQSGSLVERTITIRNSGLANLTITLPTVLGGTAMASYSIVAQPTTPIVSSGSTTCTIRLSPTTAGTKPATLTITNNDASEGTFVINLTGTATPGPGSTDTSFQPTLNGAVATLANTAAPLFFGGEFTVVNGVGRTRFARVDLSGVLLPQSGTGANGRVYCAVQLTSGQILIGGDFTTVHGVARSRLARLNADGSLDTTFNLAANGTVTALAVQPDGAVLIVGAFVTLGGVSRSGGFARITGNAVDATFDPVTGGTLRVVTVQSDGKILIGGTLFYIGGSFRHGVARLLSNGSLDASFGNPGLTTAAGLPCDVRTVAIQADGKLLVAAANLGKVGAVSHTGVVRLNADGTLDATFVDAGGEKFGVILQADGRPISWRQTMDTMRRASTLNATDAGFVSTVTSNVNVVALQADGKVLAGLSNAAWLLRLINDTTASSSLTVTNAARVQWLRGGTAPEAQFVTFDLSEDGTNWTPLGTGTRISGGWELTGLSLPIDGTIRARARCGVGMLETTQAFSGLLVPDLEIVCDGEVLDSGELQIFNGALPTQTVELTFGIRNTGNADLTGLVLTPTGDFTVLSLGATTLAAGASTTAILRFTPAAVGYRYATMSITSNVPGVKAGYSISLRGSGWALPTATTSAASLVTSTQARLAGTFKANHDVARYFWEYKRTVDSVWTRTTEFVMAGFTAVPLTTDITGLTASTAYQFKAGIYNSLNPTTPVYGSVLTFNTTA